MNENQLFGRNSCNGMHDLSAIGMSRKGVACHLALKRDTFAANLQLCSLFGLEQLRSVALFILIAGKKQTVLFARSKFQRIKGRCPSCKHTRATDNNGRLFPLEQRGSFGTA